ncbi:MAG: hypothetical protein ACYTG0_42575 [Planctomycetota bacterium]|jgi:hypothetical protein
MSDLPQIKISFPLILPAVNPQFDKDGCYVLDKGSRFIGAAGTAEEKALVLFTNVSLAEHYVHCHGAEFQPVDIETPAAAIEIARGFNELHNCVRIAIDPPAGVMPVPAIPMGRFVEALQSFSESG